MSENEADESENEHDEGDSHDNDGESEGDGLIYCQSCDVNCTSDTMMSKDGDPYCSLCQRV